jgi:uncharacterized protein (DUF58 family)
MKATPDTLRQIQLRARAWAEVLRLPLRRQRWRGQSGGQVGLGTGSSLEFHDQRAYQPGDDPRQINWQAYARTGNYTMKLYQEEVRPLVDLVLDASESLFAFPAKEQRTLELLAFALESALASAASVRVLAVRGAAFVPLELDALLSGRWGAQLAALPAAGAAEPPALSHLPFRAGSLRVLISDLLFPTDPEPMLSALGQHQGQALVLAPGCTGESAPDWQGNYEFVDAESQATQTHRVEPELLKRYLEAYARHFDLWKRATLKHGIALVRVAAEPEFLDALRAEGLPSQALELA